MKENEKLKKLFRDHFNGDPWIDVSIAGSLKDIKAADAAKRLYGLNSIWQIVHHMTCWRETLLERLRGALIPSPADNYFTPVSDPSAKAWTQALTRLKISQKNILLYLQKEWKDADQKPGSSPYSRYELIQGLLQHDAYHLGQVLLIKKLLLAGK
jgi:uncharacterized damage-inducible protein DinB